MASVLVVCDEDLAESFLQVGPKSSQQISEEGGSRRSHDSCVHRERLTSLVSHTTVCPEVDCSSILHALSFTSVTTA